ncbi:MAG: hypothetical protein PHQ18_03250 [Patescibacteria group bacterium]|nr:hypothetical protein [Patescibacteria group bacterium]
MIRIAINIFVFIMFAFTFSCTNGVDFVFYGDVSYDIAEDAMDSVNVDVVDTLTEDTFVINVDTSDEEDAFSFLDIWHKSPCGQAQECGSFNNFACPASSDSCAVSGCVSGCCVVVPDSPDCCHEDVDCAEDETCDGGKCKKFTCPPVGLPGECFEFSVPYRNVCFTKYLPSAVCTSQRPVECRHDTDCWDDSTCVENHCQQLNCLAGLDAGCYETDVSPFAADWRCIYDLQSDGTVCDDGDACTDVSTCHSGQCRGVGLAGCNPP